MCLGRGVIGLGMTPVAYPLSSEMLVVRHEFVILLRLRPQRASAREYAAELADKLAPTRSSDEQAHQHELCTGYFT